MSNAKKCDRCKCLYEIYTGLVLKSNGSKYNSMYISNGYKDKRYDLCPNCMSYLIYWIKKGDIGRPVCGTKMEIERSEEE